jgi:hypothetical protein
VRLTLRETGTPILPEAGVASYWQREPQETADALQEYVPAETYRVVMVGVEVV